ncbi:hypothetical protein PoB_000438400 [Plakobranchus ocellatus]|uniref:Uncharacterized protein n=1 Tax=Plakobranchus ocellatus TaxID=259542 RepID=A0AAV3Y4J8_9GAST|nr:hypothetical protein PoB_000438400 [Plakobranchus ocellatus]
MRGKESRERWKEKKERVKTLEGRRAEREERRKIGLNEEKSMNKTRSRAKILLHLELSDIVLANPPWGLPFISSSSPSTPWPEEDLKA